MQTFNNFEGKTVYFGLYDEGIMKQIGKLDASISNKGYEAFQEIYEAYKTHHDLNGGQIRITELTTASFMAGYLEGIRAERARKKKNR